MFLIHDLFIHFRKVSIMRVIKGSSTLFTTWTYGIFIFICTCLSMNYAWSQVRVGDLVPDQIARGEQLEFTLYGDNFASGMTVSFVDNNQQAVNQLNVQGSIDVQFAEDIGDGRGDRATFTLYADPSTTVATYNLLVNVPNENAVYKYVALKVVEGSNSMNDQMDNNMNDNMNDNMNQSGDDRYDNLPPRQEGQINAITSASPPVGEVGAQVNLWIEGRDFDDNPTIKFSSNELFQAYSNNQPIPLEVVHNLEYSNGELDGIMYFLRISAQASLGPIDITVQNSNGSSYTLMGEFEVVAQGSIDLENVMDAENIEGVTGASPLAIATGVTSPMWIWGTGFNRQSVLSFNNNAIRDFRPPKVIINAQNYPGYDGVQAFLDVPTEANTGPVDVTITNPNGSNETGIALFEIVNTGDVSGSGNGGDNVSGIRENCDGNDLNTSIVEISAVDPNEIERNKVTSIEIIGSGFACGASIVYHGGGITPVSAPIFSKDPSNPSLNYFRVDVDVAADAALGSRAITIVNPNGSVKTNAEAFRVIEANNESAVGSGAACKTLPTHSHTSRSMDLIMMLFMVFMFFVRATLHKKI